MDTAAASVVTSIRLVDIPPIGAPLAGGECAGVSVHDNKPVVLVLLPGEVEKNWKDAQAWAQEQGGELPNRFDAIALFKNLRDRFQRVDYWTSEPSAGDERYAWYQHFTYGYQDLSHKDTELRARAVRRLPIQ